MKKSTILAVSLVLAATISVLRFGPEWTTNSIPERPQPVASPPLVESDEQPIEPSTVEIAAPADVVAAPLPPSGPTPLFAEPSELGIEYADAVDQIVQFREATEPTQITWNKIIEPDLVAASRFFEEATLRPDGFAESFSLNLFPAYQPCVISSVNRVRQLDEPEMYRIYTSCDNGGSPVQITALYDAQHSTFNAALSNQDVNLQIARLKDSKFAWAFEIDRGSHRVSDR